MTVASQREISWEGSVEMPATAETLDMLFDGKIAGLCVPNFLTAEECSQLKKKAGEYEFKDYLNVVPRIEKIGITVFEFDKIGKQHYFEAVGPANRSIARITDGICSPLQRALDWFATLCPHHRVSVASEPGYGSYFAGLFRRIEEGTLVHVDFAPMEQPGWAVAEVCSQLTFNIYLDVPPVNPGVVHIWQKQWQPEDELFRVPDSYGYTEEAVADIPFATITPQRGMLMVINTRNFHQVSPAQGMRLAVASAAGRLPDKNVVLWS